MFPCLDCALGGVAAMHVRRNKLKSHLVFLESSAEFFTALIVENMKFRGVAIALELEKKSFLTGFAAWRVLIGFERIKFVS